MKISSIFTQNPVHSNQEGNQHCILVVGEADGEAVWVEDAKLMSSDIVHLLKRVQGAWMLWEPMQRVILPQSWGQLIINTNFSLFL